MKKDLLPLECQDKKTFSNFPWKLQNTHQHPGSKHSRSPAAGPSEWLSWFREGGDRAMSLLLGVQFLSCPWDLTRAFYNLFLYNTRKERLKTNTRLKMGLGLATAPHQMLPTSSWKEGHRRLRRCSLKAALMVKLDNTCKQHGPTRVTVKA